MRLLYKPINLFTRYKYPYNINRQENRAYLRKVEKAEELLDESQKVQLIPRRKRRVYDRPRINRDIEGYGAWRVYERDEFIYKVHDHCMEVDLKLYLSPKWLIHAFGKGSIPFSNKRSAHREFMFIDNQWGGFLLYEYRNTTDFKPNVENYDYENQEHLHPRMRINKRVSPEEFWQSEEEFEFRVNASAHAQKHKFEEWIKAQIEKRKSKKNYDEFIDEKYGKPITYNTVQQSSLFAPHKPMILSITPDHFAPKKGKQPKLPTRLTWMKLGEQHRVEFVGKSESQNN